MVQIREMHPKLQEKAIAELNEDPKRIPEDIEHLKQWLAKQQHIKARQDDQFLVSFLRGCKYSLEKSKEKLDMYYTLKTITPELYGNRDPMRPELQKILANGIMLPLPRANDPTAPMYCLVRIGAMPNIYMPDAFKVAAMLKDVQILENDNLVVSGICILQDMSNIKLSNLIGFSPSLVKKTLMCFQKGYPLRITGMHVKNPTTAWEAFNTLASPFFSQKFKKRISILPRDEDVFKIFPKEVLPEEYGGTAGKLEDLIQAMKTKVESYRDWFLEDSKYGTDEKKRPGKPKTSEAVFGVDGSFRKLDVD